jgi:hypothetical protein
MMVLIHCADLKALYKFPGREPKLKQSRFYRFSLLKSITKDHRYTLVLVATPHTIRQRISTSPKRSAAEAKISIYTFHNKIGDIFEVQGRQMLGFILCSHGTESPVEFLQLRKREASGK